MPTFENTEITTTVDIDFEVYCGTCGAGLCNESDTRKSKNRNYLQVTVNACPDYMAAKDKKIDELNEIIENLEIQLSNK